MPNSVFGRALNLAVPFEAATTTGLKIQVTALPTNGNLVLSDGSTRVTVGEFLTAGQAAKACNFKPNGLAQSSHFDFDYVIPGIPPTHRSSRSTI